MESGVRLYHGCRTHELSHMGRYGFIHMGRIIGYVWDGQVNDIWDTTY